MDHQAFAQLLGNYGEFFGAIAVVVTLIYLAGQLRQNTRALKASAYQAWNSDHQSITDLMANHPLPFAKLRQGQELTVEDQVILESYAYKAFSQMEVTFLQYAEGGVPKEIFEARMSGLRTLMNTIPLVAQVWQVAQDFAYSPAFVSYVDEHIVSGNPS
jgi:hypothetical protein